MTLTGIFEKRYDMKFNIKIPVSLRKAYMEEIRQYHSAMEAGRPESAWRHLERSHIIGQSYPVEHSYSHWLMLKFGLRQQKAKEVFAQILRLLVGGWKSFIDHVPLGNTGGSDIPPMRRLPLPDDISLLLRETR